MATGKETPISSGLIARVSGKLQEWGWFGAGKPLPPVAPPDYEPRGFDFAIALNTLTQKPRQDEPVSFDDMRALANNCSVLAAVIQTRKDQLTKLRWKFQPKRKDGENSDAYQKRAASDVRVKELTDFFAKPDKEHDWPIWLGAMLDDLLVIDAVSIYPRKTKGGQLFSLNLIDGATIKRLIDDNAMTPMPPEAAYQQIIKGVPAKNLSTEQLMYRPRNVRTHKLYGFSPVEQIILAVNIALRRDIYAAEFYTEGNMPDVLLRVPDTWTPKQIEEFSAAWELLNKSTADRRKAKFIPNFDPFLVKPNALTDGTDEWLARVICYAFSVPCSPFIKETNRATAETQKEQSMEEGLQPYQLYIEGFVNEVVRLHFKYDDIEFNWQDDREEDSLKQAQIDNIHVRAGIKGIDEVRKKNGDDPVGVPPAIITASGLLPLSMAVEQAQVGLDSAKALAANGGVPPDQVEDKPVGGNGKKQGADTEKIGKSKKKLLKLAPDRDTPEKSKWRGILASSTNKFFKATAKHIAAVVAANFVTTEKSSKSKADDILKKIDFDSWVALTHSFTPALEAVAKESTASAFSDLSINDDKLFDIVQQDAIEWAQDRAAELVGKTYNAKGQLIDNPSPKWAITESTRDGLRDLIVSAYEDGIDVKSLAQQIEDSYLFSESRAEMIARTELAKADSQTTLIAWKQSGVVIGKLWILGSEHDDGNPDECDDNADQGTVDLDDSFDSGDDAPPAHPNCVCALITQFLVESGEIAEDES